MLQSRRPVEAGAATGAAALDDDKHPPSLPLREREEKPRVPWRVYARRATRSRSAWSLALFALALVVVLWVMVGMVEPEGPTGGAGEEVEEDVIVLADVTDASLHKEWLQVLREGKIARFESYSPGLAEKYVCVFESGHKAAVKPMEQWHFFSRDIPVWDWELMTREGQVRVSRAQWEYQGWSEVVGYHLDQVLGWNLKPPVSGRVLSSKALFTFDYAPFTIFRRLLPEHGIAVSMHAWVDDLQSAVPSSRTRDVLIMQKSLEGPDIEAARSVSTKIVFDYLIDDHDGTGAQNYKRQGQGQLLHWDSGLAFRHGPHGIEGNVRPGKVRRCTDILCGLSVWKKWYEERVQKEAKPLDKPEASTIVCPRICRFSKAVIEQLQEVARNSSIARKAGRQDPLYQHGLAAKLERSLRSDPTFPVTQYGYFYANTFARKWLDHGLVRFLPDNFWKGIEHRIVELLMHVNSCIEVHGASQVLI